MHLLVEIVIRHRILAVISNSLYIQSTYIILGILKSVLWYMPDMFAYNNSGIRMVEVGGSDLPDNDMLVGSNAFAIWDTIIGSAWWIRSESHTRWILV